MTSARRPERRLPRRRWRRAAAAATSAEKKPRSAASTIGAGRDVDERGSRRARRAAATRPWPSRPSKTALQDGRASSRPSLARRRSASPAATISRAETPGAQRPPQAARQQPQRPEQQRRPAKAFADEFGALRRGGRIGRIGGNKHPVDRHSSPNAGAATAPIEQFHSAPLVEGMRSAWRASIAIAAPSARATPLKQDFGDMMAVGAI